MANLAKLGGAGQAPRVRSDAITEGGPVHAAQLVADTDTRQRELRQAHQLFTALGATGHAEQLAKEIGC